MALFVRETGQGDATIVLLHGFGGSHRAWDAIAPALSVDHRILACDLPGHGGSLDHPGAGPAKVAAKAVLADLAARGIGRAHLVGHSMGGAVAVLCGLFEPSRVASLTLLAPGGFGPEINHRLLSRMAAARDAATIRLCLENMFGWSSPVDEAAVAEALALRSDPRQSAMLAAIAPTLVRDGKQGEIPRETLASLAMPVQVLWGRLDNVLPVAQAEGLPAAFQVHLFDGIGHMLPQEIPGEVVRHVRNLVEPAAAARRGD